MRFTFAILFLNVSLAVVSALPRPIYSTGIISRDTEITLERRVSTASNPPTRKQPSRQSRLDAASQAAKKEQLNPKWQVDLHQKKPTTENEHWSLRFHPQIPGKDHLHVVDAISLPDTNSILSTDQRDLKRYKGPQPPNPNEPHPSITTHIANFADKNAATKARKDVKDVKLTEPYPQQNCVDWTCHAVDRMVEKNRISANAPGVQAFHGIYQSQKETVRERTATAKNKYAALTGIPPSQQQQAGPSQPVAGPSHSR